MPWLQREHGILVENINDCPEVHVRPMDPANAMAMVRAMIAYVKPERWSPDIAATLVQLLPALYPGVIQYAFSRIRDIPNLDSPRLGQIYVDDISSGLENDYYRQFDRRLQYHVPDERIVIGKMLDAIHAAPNETLPWDDALRVCTADGSSWIARELLTQLVDDCFIVAGREAGVRFSSGLVRVWHKGSPA
jgi:hypothetical protein